MTPKWLAVLKTQESSLDDPTAESETPLAGLLSEAGISPRLHGWARLYLARAGSTPKDGV